MSDNDPRDNDELREAICAWLRANGIDPSDVPERARASLANGMLTVPMYVRDDQGRHRIVPAGGGVVTETITVPVTAPPPLVAQWLAPRCPTCGR